MPHDIAKQVSRGHAQGPLLHRGSVSPLTDSMCMAGLLLLQDAALHDRWTAGAARLGGLGDISRPASVHGNDKASQGRLPLRRQGLALAEVQQHQRPVLLQRLSLALGYLCGYLTPCSADMFGPNISA